MKAEEAKVGCFQMVLVLLLSVNYVIVAMNHALPVFHNYAPEFECQMENATNVTGGCGIFTGNDSAEIEGQRRIFCESEFIENKGRSVAMEWGLICEKRYLTFLGPTVYYVGVLIGAWIAGFLADRIGRLPVQAICLYTQGTLAVALYVVQDYPVFLAIRGLQGIFVQGLQNCTYILSLELFPAKARALVALLMQIAWAGGLVLLAVLSYVIPDWRILQLAVSVPTAVTVLYIWMIPESPRWLLARGKSTEADMALERIAKYNGCCSRKSKNCSDKTTMANDTDGNVIPAKPERKSRLSTGDLRKAKNDEKMQDEATNLLTVNTELEQQKVRKMSMKVIAENIEDHGIDVKLRKKSASSAESKKIERPSTSRNSRRSKSNSQSIVPQRASLRNADEIEIEVKPPPVDTENGTSGSNKKIDINVDGKNEKPHEGFVELFKHPLLRKYLTIMVYQWFTSAIAGYFVESLLPNFKVNRHVIFAMGGGLEIISYILAYFALKKAGRRFSICIYQFLNATICVIVAALIVLPNASANWIGIVKTVVLLLGRIVAVGTIFIVYLYTIEVFPTVIRGTCLGMCTVFAKIGSLSTLHVLLSGEHISVFIPIIVVGALCLFSGILAPILPETINAILPDTFDEVARFANRRKNGNIESSKNENTTNGESIERNILQKKLFSEDWVDAGNGILVNFTETKTAD